MSVHTHTHHHTHLRMAVQRAAAHTEPRAGGEWPETHDGEVVHRGRVSVELQSFVGAEAVRQVLPETRVDRDWSGREAAVRSFRERVVERGGGEWIGRGQGEDL